LKTQATLPPAGAATSEVGKGDPRSCSRVTPGGGTAPPAPATRKVRVRESGRQIYMNRFSPCGLQLPSLAEILSVTHFGTNGCVLVTADGRLRACGPGPAEHCLKDGLKKGRDLLESERRPGTMKVKPMKQRPLLAPTPPPPGGLVLKAYTRNLSGYG